MKYGICELCVVPLRAEAKDEAEMVSQLLLGDLVEILDVQNNWTKVRCLFDDYIGWMDTKQVSELSQDEFENILSANQDFVHNHYTKVNFGTNKTFAPLGATFYNLKSSFLKYSIIQDIEENNQKTISSVALSFLNAPYLWGGKTIYGIDCSGFTQTVFKLFRIQLKRDASQQVKQGTSVNFSEAQENDLAFFSNTKGKVTHVGIILKDLKIIHASGKVRIDTFNEKGILNSDTNKLTHTFHSCRRY